MPLGAGGYLQGCFAVLLVAGAVGWGACRLRARLVPDWRGGGWFARNLLLVAISPFYRVHADLALDELAPDPAATVVVRNDLGIVYRIDGRLATDVCGAEQAG